MISPVGSSVPGDTEKGGGDERRETVRLALAGVLLNTHNYPRRARWLLEGTDTTQMIDLTTDVVMRALAAAEGTSS